MGASLNALWRSGVLVLVGLAFGATFVMLGIAGVTMRAQCPDGGWAPGGCSGDVDATETGGIAAGGGASAAASPEVRATTAHLSGRDRALAQADGWIGETFRMLASLPASTGGSERPVEIAAVVGEPVPEIPHAITLARSAEPPPAIARRTVASVAVDSRGQPIWPTATASAAAAEAAEVAGATDAEKNGAPVIAYAPVPQVRPASLRAPAEETQRAPAAGAAGTRTVLGQGVNVRSNPSSGAEKLFALAGGKVVTVTGEERGWLRIIDGEGRTGWAYSRFLSQP